MKKRAALKGNFASQLIDARIEEPGDWRGKMLSRLRSLIKEADPEVVESGSGAACRYGHTMD